MIDILIYLAIALAAIVVIAEFVAFRKNATVDLPRLWQSFATIEKASQSTERSVKEEIAKHGESVRAEIAKLRDEGATAARQSREELAGSLKGLETTLNQNLASLRQTVDQKLQRLQEDTAGQLAAVQTDAAASAKTLREEIAKSLNGFQETLVKSVAETAKLQQTQLTDFSTRLDKLAGTTEQKLDGAKAAVETKLRALQDDHVQRLEQLRATVDEKLQGTEKRLSESFRLAGERMEQAVTRPVPPQ